MRHRTTLIAAALATGLGLGAGAPALAADAAALQVEESELYGRYLTDGAGRTLYIFTADTQGGEGRKAVIACGDDGCLQRWPLLTGDAPEAAEGVQAELIGSLPHGEDRAITYNGWPLYYFYKDKGPGDVGGQDIGSFGGEWYLIAPDGSVIETERPDEHKHES